MSYCYTNRGVTHTFFTQIHMHMRTLVLVVDIHSATNEFRDLPWKTSLKQDI